MREMFYSLAVATIVHFVMLLLGIDKELPVTGLYIACWLGTEYKRIARVVSNAFLLR